MQISTFVFSTFILSAATAVSATTLPGQQLDHSKRGDGVYCDASTSCHAIYDDPDHHYIDWYDARATSRVIDVPEECNLVCGPGQQPKSYLVSVNNAGEQACLVNLMDAFAPTVVCDSSTANNPDMCPRPWIGAHQDALGKASLIEPAGDFEWDSGEPFYFGACDTSCNKTEWLNDMIVNTAWQLGQPNDGTKPEVEHFVELNPLSRPSNLSTKNSRWLWNDRAPVDENKFDNTLYIVEFKCVDDPNTNGDPHFTTWSGEKFDYHGKCDLELMSDPEFNNGQGLHIHVRTEIVRTWSYIKAAAIKLGDDILEVEGSLDPKEQRHWINGVFNGELTTIGGHRVAYKTNGRRRRYIVYLSDGAKIVLGAYKDWVRVDVYNPHRELFKNTVGLLGDYDQGKKLGRDGQTVVRDVYEFGQEWQVLADAPMLFHEVSGPQAPFDKCIVPENPHAEDGNAETAQLRGRRLSEASFTREEAVVACSQPGIRTRDLDNCVQDVLAMDDLDFAEAHMMDEDEDEFAPGSF